MLVGRQLPLCARCTGIYLGAFSTLLLIFFSKRTRYIRFPDRPQQLLFALLLALMGIDGVNSFAYTIGYATPYVPNNYLRLITGFGAGIVFGSVIWWSFSATMWWNGRMGANVTGRSAIILLTILIFLLISCNQMSLLFVMGIISAGTVPLLLTLLYATIAMSWQRGPCKNRPSTDHWCDHQILQAL